MEDSPPPSLNSYSFKTDTTDGYPNSSLTQNRYTTTHFSLLMEEMEREDGRC